MASKPANAKQKKWMKDISEFISENGLGFLYGREYENRYDFQLHHVLGRSARHNKVPIGHEFIIPVPVELHDVNSNHPFNVTHHKKAFVTEFGKQSGIFQMLYSCMDKWNDFDGYNFSLPSREVYNAIIDTNA